jgi:multidrug efflux system membrane fusion protein
MTDSTEQSQTTAPAVPPPTPRARGLIWFVLLLVIAGVAGYAVWRAGRPASAQRVQGPGGGGGGGGGRGGRGGANGPVPVVVATVGRSSIPVYLNGLGNVTAFYTVTIKSRVDG